MKLIFWKRICILLTAVLAMQKASAQVINYANGFPAAPKNLTANQLPVVGPAFSNGLAHLTTNVAQSESIFSSYKVNVARFTNTFDFLIINGADNGSDGFTFTIQSDSANALGSNGGYLGYNGQAQGFSAMPHSLCIKFDLHQNTEVNDPSGNCTGLFTGGQAPFGGIDLNGTGVDLHSEHTMRAAMTYDGTTLNVTITDLVTQASATQSYIVDILGLVGGNKAYVGFTAGTGIGGAQQDIKAWKFASIIPVPQAPLENTATGQVAFWALNGPTITGKTDANTSLPLNWHIVATGDFSGDGNKELVLQNLVTGQVALWYLQGATVTGGALLDTKLPANWQIMCAGDFNQDGKADLALQNMQTQQVAFWYLNGTSVTSGAYAIQIFNGAPIGITLPGGWQIAGSGDFHSDGQLELVLQNLTSGQVAYWSLNGATVTGGAYASETLPQHWQIAGIGDIDGNGSPDMLLENLTTGQVAYWFTQGALITRGQLANMNLPMNMQLIYR